MPDAVAGQGRGRAGVLISEIDVQIRAVRGNGKRGQRRGGLGEARRQSVRVHFGAVIPRRNAGEKIPALAVGRPGSHQVVIVVEQADQHVGDARLAGVPDAVAVQVQPHRVACGAHGGVEGPFCGFLVIIQNGIVVVVHVAGVAGIVPAAVGQAGVGSPDGVGDFFAGGNFLHHRAIEDDGGLGGAPRDLEGLERERVVVIGGRGNGRVGGVQRGVRSVEKNVTRIGDGHIPNLEQSVGQHFPKIQLEGGGVAVVGDEDFPADGSARLGIGSGEDGFAELEVGFHHRDGHRIGFELGIVSFPVDPCHAAPVFDGNFFLVGEIIGDDKFKPENVFGRGSGGVDHVPQNQPKLPIHRIVHGDVTVGNVAGHRPRRIGRQRCVSRKLEVLRRRRQNIRDDHIPRGTGGKLESQFVGQDFPHRDFVSGGMVFGGVEQDFSGRRRRGRCDVVRVVGRRKAVVGRISESRGGRVAYRVALDPTGVRVNAVGSDRVGQGGPKDEFHRLARRDVPATI